KLHPESTIDASVPATLTRTTRVFRRPADQRNPAIAPTTPGIRPATSAELAREQEVLGYRPTPSRPATRIIPELGERLPSRRLPASDLIVQGIQEARLSTPLRVPHVQPIEPHPRVL